MWSQERKAFASEQEEELVKLALLLEKLATLLWQRSDPLIQNSDAATVQLCAALLARDF